MHFVKAETKILFGSDLKPLSRLILVGLKYFDRGNGRGCFASKETMSNMLGMSLWQLRTGLKELQEKNYIHIDKRGQGNTDVIFVIDADEDEKSLESTSEKSYGVDSKNSKASIPNYISKENELEGRNASNEEKDKASSLTPPAPDDTPIDVDATERCQKRLQAFLRVTSWETYFKDAFVTKESDTEVHLVIPSVIVFDFLSQHYKEKLNQALGKNVILSVGVSRKNYLGEKANMV